MSTVPAVVLYGDFNCPFSALAAARADRLERAGRLHVDWRCAEHDPSIGPYETPLTPEQHAAFAAELEQVAGLLTDGEQFPARVPSRRLNTRDLNLTYAAAPMAMRPGLRAEIFAAYWFHDVDLTDDLAVAGIVASVAKRVGDDDAGATESTPPTTAASRSTPRQTVAAWQAEWLALPRPIVPVMVLPDGSVSRGLGALARLADGSVSAPSPRRTDGPA